MPVIVRSTPARCTPVTPRRTRSTSQTASWLRRSPGFEALKMRRQLRPFHSAERLAEIYDHSYDHTCWPEHQQRVDWTIRAGVVIAEHRYAQSLVDLSCGDGAVLRGIQAGMTHGVELTFG